jgi:hypothetical protein
MTTITALTPEQATQDARDILAAIGVTPSRITSTDMGYCEWLGGHVIETEARVTFADLPAAAAVLDALPGAQGCECMHACAAVYRVVA